MADLRRARTPEPVRDRTADPPVGVDRQTQIDDRGTPYAPPRHAREREMESWQDREKGGRYAPERERMGGPPGPRPMAASALSAFALLGGVWLVISRLVFNFPAAGSLVDGVLNGVVIGIAVFLTALGMMSSASSTPALGFALVILGGWMIPSPWIFNYGSWGANSGPTYSDVITGVGIAALGLATLLARMVRQMSARRTGRAT